MDILSSLLSPRWGKEIGIRLVIYFKTSYKEENKE